MLHPPCVRTDTTRSLTLPCTTMLECSNAIYPSRNTHRRPPLSPILKKTLMRSQLCRGRASVFLRRRFYSPSPVATTTKGPWRVRPNHSQPPLREPYALPRAFCHQNYKVAGVQHLHSWPFLEYRWTCSCTNSWHDAP